MSTKKNKKEKTAPSTTEKNTFQFKRQHKFSIGVLLILLALALLISFISYFFAGNIDQSATQDVFNREIKVQNWLGKFGAYLADFFLYKGFGVASFLFVKMLFFSRSLSNFRYFVI